jgi:hypothetical protein
MIDEASTGPKVRNASGQKKRARINPRLRNAKEVCLCQLDVPDFRWLATEPGISCPRLHPALPVIPLRLAKPCTRNTLTLAIMLTERSIVGNFAKRLTSWYIRLFQRFTTSPIVAPRVSGVRIRRPRPDFSAESHFDLYLRLFQQHCDDSSSRRVELRHGSHRSFVRKN